MFGRGQNLAIMAKCHPGDQGRHEFFPDCSPLVKVLPVLPLKTALEHDWLKSYADQPKVAESAAKIVTRELGPREYSPIKNS